MHITLLNFTLGITKAFANKKELAFSSDVEDAKGIMISSNQTPTKIVRSSGSGTWTMYTFTITPLFILFDGYGTSERTNLLMLMYLSSEIGVEYINNGITGDVSNTQLSVNFSYDKSANTIIADYSISYDQYSRLESHHFIYGYK